MTMNKHLLIILTLLVGALLWPSRVQAQTSITTFTITEPVTSGAIGQITLTVSSGTGMAANGILYLDGTVYRIVSVSGTSVVVLSTYKPAAHLDNAAGFIVPVAAQAPYDPVGSCLRSTAGSFPQYSPYTLMFNLTNGNISMCQGASGSRTWVTVNPYGVGAKSANPPQTP